MAKRAKQGLLLEDMGPPRFKDLDDAAEVYFEAMQERMQLTRAEDEAKDNLIDKMKTHGLAVYKSSHEPPLVVTMTEKSNVRVKQRGENVDL